jgi:membrane protease YdiL (CAAX protease family)
MTQIINDFISAILQVMVFTLIPFIFFLFRKDKTVTFFKYIGLYKPTARSISLVLVVILISITSMIGMALVNDGIKQAMFSPESVTGKFREMGLNFPTIISLLIMAFIKTSLSEEILFRGFIGKRLINKLGFKKGNLIQAAIFGLLHLLLFWVLTKTTIVPLIVITVFSTLMGWIIGYIKEKYANGSVIPGWVAHGLGNTISYSIIAFAL